MQGLALQSGSMGTMTCHSSAFLFETFLLREGRYNQSDAAKADFVPAYFSISTIYIARGDKMKRIYLSIFLLTYFLLV